MYFEPPPKDNMIIDTFVGAWVLLKLIAYLVSLAFLGIVFIAIFFFDLWQWRKKRQNAASAQTAAAHADRTP